MKRIAAIAALMALCAALGACRADKERTNENTDHCSVNGRQIFFVEDEVKREWKEPLKMLLSNVYVGSCFADGYGSQASINPDAPAIVDGYSCGLLDITSDGIPELLVHPVGFFGSSGTVTYFIYDMYTGQYLGAINGGGGESWCVYYDIRTDETLLVGQYWLRYGWDERSRSIVTAGYSEESGEYCECPYLHTLHHIDGGLDAVLGTLPDDPYYADDFGERYPATAYYIHDEPAYLDEYYDEYDRFVQSCIRIPETELIMIRWSDYGEDEKDYNARGERMADALISSAQEFIDFKR